MAPDFGATVVEQLALIAATGAHCTCEQDMNGIRHANCPAHSLLADEDRIRHLVYARRRYRALGQVETLEAA